MTNERQSRQAEAVSRSLRALIRDTYKGHFGNPEEAGEWSFDIKVKMDPQQGYALNFDPPLPQQLLDQMQFNEAACNVYQPGRVFCFRCETSECNHAVPSSPLEVFKGYDQVGQPHWSEMAQLMLDLGDERVDLLFGDRPRPMARLIFGRDLRARQLAQFGRASKTYALLGQVIAGYFRTGRDHERLAITFQVVEVRDKHGRWSLELNTICQTPQGVELDDLAAERFAWMGTARKQAREELHVLEQKVGESNGRKRKDLARVPEILRKLAADLERGRRQRDRRTDHARDRARHDRPIDKAMSDLQGASLERMYLDLKTSTIILRGDKGRCHVFNESGRHVTSFVIKGESVQSRLRKRRWTELQRDQFQRFMDNVASGQVKPER